jgi:hypothetical protein
METIQQVLPNPPCYDPLAAFQTTEGKKVFKSFEDGATLNVWRMSTPHSWWLKHPDGREYHWENNLKLRPAGTPDVRWLTRLGKSQSTADNSAQSTFCARTENGKPGTEAWVLDETLLAKEKANWAYAQECVKDWQAHAGTFSGSLATLSSLAQLAVLTLRSKTQLPMRGELFAILLELNAAGLLDVHPEGHATLKVPAKSLKLPKGKALKIVCVK